jgi:hypothetical protein
MHKGNAGGIPRKIQEQVYPDGKGEQYEQDVKKFAASTLFPDGEIEENQG